MARTHTILAITVASTLLAAACVSNDTVSPPVGSGDGRTSASTSVNVGESSDSWRLSDADCPRESKGSTWSTDITAEAAVLQEGDASTPRVTAVRYPHPDYEGKPWSQWGQGIVAPDGRFFSAIGDHHGADGNSYFYVYDPETENLRLISDVLSLVDHDSGSWGYGKVHGRMVPGPCGQILATTYWGSRRGLSYSGSYEGDLLISVSPESETISADRVLVAERGVPSLATWHAGQLLYAEAAQPVQKGNKGEFVVIDLATGDTAFIDDGPLNGFRSIAVDGNGRALYSIGPGRLRVYDPATNSASDFPEPIPGEVLRAVTHPSADGTVYAVTADPAVFFAIEPDGSIRELGAAPAYTTSLALAEDRSEVFFMPGAHGNAWRGDGPLVALDVETGDLNVVVELDPLVRSAMNLRVGGTYDVAYDAAAGRVFIGLNVSPASDDSGFGDVILVTVTLP